MNVRTIAISSIGACLVCLAALTCKADPVCNQFETIANSTMDTSKALACKPLPGQQSRYVVVYPSSVAIVDAKERDIISESATPLHSTWDHPVSIDTARYILAPGVRAFGVRYTSDRHSYDVGEGDELFYLYIVDGDRLRLLVNGLVMHAQITNDGCDSGGAQPAKICHPGKDEVNRIISVGSTSHNGFSDLYVQEAQRGCTDNMPKKTPCSAISKKAFKYTAKATLAYDGERYSIPDGLDNGILLQW